jgi:hypothetical protein
MNKNNFFIKFARMYIGNLKAIKDILEDLWDDTVDSIMKVIAAVFTVSINIFRLIDSLISIFIPIKQIIFTFLIHYPTADELNELYLEDKDAGFYLKSSIRKRKEKIKQELEDEKDFIDRQMSCVNLIDKEAPHDTPRG